MSAVNASGAIQRITREIASHQKGDDLSIAVACDDSDVRHVRALIIGPPDSPYEFGFFEFDMKFSKDYPIKSPVVKCITTNSGRTRFNPNIYAEGKVCLSILGTWRGEPGEEWSSAQGLESVLLSIQSLMSSNPYENEPGYEETKKEDPMSKAYVAKIRHETLRVSIIKRLEDLLHIKPNQSEPLSKRLKSSTHGSIPVEPAESSTSQDNSDASIASSSTASVYEYDAEATFNALDSKLWDPFADLLKRRFLWYFDSYMQTINTHGGQQSDGTAFKRMEFEYPLNSMDGHFDYMGLRSRLEHIFAKLEDEERAWEREALQQTSEGTQLATQLAFQFTQLRNKWNQKQFLGSRMEISLPDTKNPFVWSLAIFGEPMTNLDGGVFNAKLRIPPGFPDAQPRVRFESPIHHHRVSSKGTLCYFPKKIDEIGSHLEAIVDAVDDKEAKYDPRAMVNPEVFNLYWHSEDKRKTYNRKLRRSAQESSLELDPRKARNIYEWVVMTILQRLKMLEG